MLHPQREQNARLNSHSEHTAPWTLPDQSGAPKSFVLFQVI